MFHIFQDVFVCLCLYIHVRHISLHKSKGGELSITVRNDELQREISKQPAILFSQYVSALKPKTIFSISCCAQFKITSTLNCN